MREKLSLPICCLMILLAAVLMYAAIKEATTLICSELRQTNNELKALNVSLEKIAP
jgi:hypothetical protein